MPAASPRTLDVLRRLVAGQVPVPEGDTRPRLPEPDMSDVAADTPHELRAQIRTHRARAAANRDRPRYPRFQLGTLREDFMGDVAELRSVRVADLQPTEACTGDASQRRYEQWARQGARIPPLTVLELPGGGMRISDGHHRWCAARAAGIERIDAWVDPAWIAHGRESPDGSVFESIRGFGRKQAACLWKARGNEQREYDCLHGRG